MHVEHLHHLLRKKVKMDICNRGLNESTWQASSIQIMSAINGDSQSNFVVVRRVIGEIDQRITCTHTHTERDTPEIKGRTDTEMNRHQGERFWPFLVAFDCENSDSNEWMKRSLKTMFHVRKHERMKEGMEGKEGRKEGCMDNSRLASPTEEWGSSSWG